LTQLVKKNPKHLDIILGLNRDQSGAVDSIVAEALQWNYAIAGPINGRSCISMMPQAPLSLGVHPTIFIKKQVDNRTISVISKTKLPAVVHCIITAAFPDITTFPS